MSEKAKGRVRQFNSVIVHLDEAGDECEKCEHCGEWFKLETLRTDAEGIYLCTDHFNDLVRDQS